MSTTRLPELPALPHTHIMLLSDLQSGTEPGFNRGHMEQYAHAYGLAVWKAAIESLIAELEPAAEAHREAAREETDQRCKEWHAATAVSYTTVVELARSLPLPEQGGPQ